MALLEAALEFRSRIAPGEVDERCRHGEQVRRPLRYRRQLVQRSAEQSMNDAFDRVHLSGKPPQYSPRTRNTHRGAHVLNRMPAPATQTTLGEVLARRTAEAAPELVDKLENNAVRCYSCGHRCKILDGLNGICKVRFNDGGVLRVPRGYAAALQVDPIEKKPFFHAYPGALALSFGMLGCDYHCGYCQNWVTSQALRDPVAGAPPVEVEPADLVRLAKKHGAKVITSTYNEPLITSEWAVEIFKEAKKAGLICSYVSNGNGTERVLDYISPYVDLYKVDLKGFSDAHYRDLGGTLQPVLDTIRGLKQRGIWLEVVTLVIPGFNSSDEELTNIAEFLASVDV